MILIVEDDHATRELIEAFVLGLGIECEAVDDCGSAILWLSIHKPSLLIVDYFLNELTARDVIKYCQDRHPESPILLISAIFKDVLKSVAEKLRVPYMAKPFDLDRFETAIKRYQNNER